MTSKILVHATHGQEDPERGDAAFHRRQCGRQRRSGGGGAAGRSTGSGWRRTATPTPSRRAGFPPLRDVIQAFVANGGQIWACGTCAKPRGIGEGDLVAGATIVTAAHVVEYLASGAAALTI